MEFIDDVTSDSRSGTPQGVAENCRPLDAAQHDAWRLLRALQVQLERPDRGSGPKRRRLGRLLGRRDPGPIPVSGLYIWGGVGRGKTFLMDWFYDSLQLVAKRRVHFHHFMRDVHQALSGLPRQPDPLEVVADQWRRRVLVLCLDEFVVTDIADAMILHRLLRAFFARGMTLVLTSNTRPENLYRNGLQRQLFLPAIALLLAHTQVFELVGGPDYRLRTLTQAGVYFVGGDAEDRLTEHFAHLAGGHVAAVEPFSVNGRVFPVRRVGADCAWFDFSDLCGTPRAATDYIEIARRFHTVLLSGLPVLRPHQEAAARRFVHLIDAFYDRRVKLIIAAQVPIPDLYPGGFLDFPFERVQSRLIEMQSHDYLAAPVRG